MKPNQDLTRTSSVSDPPAASCGRSTLGGWGWLSVCALAVIGAVLVFSGALGDTKGASTWLPLLFVLPCAIMMLMCMKHMGGHQADVGKSNAQTGAPQAGAEDRR